ncbi:MAG: AAA family ATPase [Lewinellaceae bacterium]|nr:AAA family ATPase [Saprospiraceae bacterium]MCB9338898.1 AAA family ATPase [Lewinellaceae bacterium]
MKIKRLFINNYKSLVNFELVEPNPFLVFVGPNAAGKSNVFEALEFFNYRDYPNPELLFGGVKSISHLNKIHNKIAINLWLDKNENPHHLIFSLDSENNRWFLKTKDGFSLKDNRDEEEENLLNEISPNFPQFFDRFSRIFVGKNDLVKIKTNGPEKLRIDAANLEPVLHRILQDEIKREEITEWLELLIPGLEKVKVAKSDLSGDYFLRIFEKHLSEPIGKNLISDGTYNILALLTAVYQSDEPQFLCIEEPENGLNPYVIRTLVGFFRQMCEEKGHYIWLNTHSATLVRELRNEEIILIDKKEGITQAKQIPPDFNRYDLEMDEAWLTNALGGGLPW